MNALIPSRVDRYVFRQLLVALLLITAGLTALIWLTQSLRFVELVVNRGLSLVVFIKLTGLLIPGFIGVILPITTYVVVQFIYQRLSGDRELTVIRAAGLSPWSLARPAMALTVVAILSGYGLNLALVPATATAFREYQFEIRNRIIAFLLQEGVFTSVSENLTVYVRLREPDGTLRGVMVDDSRDPAHRATIIAESGRLSESPTGPKAILSNGSRQELDQQTGRLNVLTFRENVVDLVQAAQNEGIRLRDISEMDIFELLNPSPGLVLERDRPKLRMEVHKRLSGPLTTFSFVMVALVAALGGEFRRHGGLLRQAGAVLAVVVLVALGLALDSLAVRHPELIPLIWLRAGLPGVVCAVWLFMPRGGAAVAQLRA